MALVGIESEEAFLKALSRNISGNSLFICLKGRSNAAGAQIQRILAARPSKVLLSLTGYARRQEMSNTRFELFVREMAGNIKNADVPVVLVAGDGAYGNIVRSVAQALSLDVQ